LVAISIGVLFSQLVGALGLGVAHGWTVGYNVKEGTL